MSTISSSGAFSTLKANNAHLWSSRRNSFNIYGNNGFIKTRSPKNSLLGQKLTPAQQRLLKSKISFYSAKEKQATIINAVVTLLVSAGIVVLSSQLLNNLI